MRATLILDRPEAAACKKERVANTGGGLHSAQCAAVLVHDTCHPAIPRAALRKFDILGCVGASLVLNLLFHRLPQLAVCASLRGGWLAPPLVERSECKHPIDTVLGAHQRQA